MSAPDRVWFSSASQASTVSAWGGNPPDGCVEYIRADLVPQWQPIETCPQEELVYVFGRNKTGEPWFNIGTLWGDEWDGPWIAELTPTHWQPLIEPSPPTT